MPAARPLCLPPENFDSLPLPVKTCSPGVLYRVHEAVYGPVYFSRNEGHRFSRGDSPFPHLYLAEEPETCLLERFGGELLKPRHPPVLSAKVWSGCVLSAITVPRLKICDFTDAATRLAAKTDLSALTHHELEIPQAWGLAVQRHPAGFDGLRYLSRFNHKPCLVLFDRGGLAAKLKAKRAGGLTDFPKALEFLDKFQVALV